MTYGCLVLAHEVIPTTTRHEGESSFIAGASSHSRIKRRGGGSLLLVHIISLNFLTRPGPQPLEMEEVDSKAVEAVEVREHLQARSSLPDSSFRCYAT